MDYRDFIKHAILEDVGEGDHSSLASIPTEAQQSCILIAKESGTLAGVEAATEVFYQIDNSLQLEWHLEDGDTLKVGDRILTISGTARSILTGERLALNFLQRMSGIATHTRRLTTIIQNTNCQVLDTRKTTPGMRYFEKQAVSIGGGTNHRFGLFDAIMLKDNHIDFCGGITDAIAATNKYQEINELKLPVIVETRNLKEVQEVLASSGVDRILLDNFSPLEMKEAIDVIAGKLDTEASGGITEENILEYAETGVNYISIGALTHQIQSLDMSLIVSD